MEEDTQQLIKHREIRFFELHSDDNQAHSATLFLADVEGILRAGMQPRGYILSTACSIAPRVPERHVRIMAEVADEIGHCH